VPRLRLAPLDFAGASLAEALGRARMCFQLGHFLLVVFLVLEEIRFSLQVALAQGLPVPLALF
jgi:uncharacterized membrane protein YtjA (UPF0391 family)